MTAIELPSLYPHQETMRDDIRAALAKYRRAILCAPPGTGKTRLAKWVLGAFATREKREDESGRAVFAVQRRGLVTNASNSFDELPRLPHGLIMAGCETSPGCDIQVASIDTVNSWYCEGGEYTTDWTYDLVVFDECVTGDAIVDTNIGKMRLDEIPSKKPSTVRSYSPSRGVHFARILTWSNKGFRDTLEIHTHCGKVRCTPDHEIYTRRGWVQAQYISPTDEILAYAGAVGCHEKGMRVRGDASPSALLSSLDRCGMNCTRQHPCANVGVDVNRGLDGETLTRGYVSGAHRDTTSTPMAVRTAQPTRSLYFQIWNDKPFWERYWETVPFAIPISEQGRHDYPARMGMCKRNGLSIRQRFCIDSTPQLGSRPMLDGAKSRCALIRPATRLSLLSTDWLYGEDVSRCRVNGSTASATSDLHGGFAMMEASLLSPCSCTLRGFPGDQTKLSLSGFAIKSEKLPWCKTAPKTPTSSTSLVGPRSRSGGEFRHTYQSACNTSWCRVTKIVHANPTDVYDIEVEGSHCFFANNLLVHNCHSHVSKLRTFLKAHDAKRRELGLRPCYVLGLSATPQHKELNKVYRTIVNGPSPSWLIENGYLSQFRYYQCTQGHLGKLVKRGDEYTSDSVAAAMDGLAGDLVADWKRLAEGRATVGFFPRRSHAYEAMELLRASGIDAHYVDGETSDDDRQGLFERLNSGDIDYICNVGVIERGTDIPRVSCVQMCTAVGNVVRWRQMIGRGSRIHPDKTDCLVLDHADGIRRHGFFDDDIEWTLEWGERPSKDHTPRDSIECPECGAVYRGGKCRACGYEPTPKERKSQGLEFVGGELREVTKTERQEKPKKSNEDLLIQALYIAGKRNMTFGQAWFIAKNNAEKQGTRFLVPARFTVAGREYSPIPKGHPDSKRKVRDTYGFTVKRYSDADNPYRIG